MERDEARTELGIIKIHKNVIASMAAIAAGEIEGVKRIGSSLKSALAEALGRKSFSSIRVEIDKNGEVRLKIPIIVKYGFNIPDTATKVQENIHTALEKNANLSIKDVDVNVRGIAPPDNKTAGRDPAEQ